MSTALASKAPSPPSPCCEYDRSEGVRAQVPLLIFAAIAGAIALPGLNDLGAAVEAVILPVLTDQQVEVGHWRGREFCWTWSFHKAHGFPLGDINSVLVRLSDGRQVLLPVYRGDLDRPFEPGAAAVAGEDASRMVCSAMPPWVTPGTAFDVLGSVTYPMAYGLWTLTHAIPTVEWRP